MARKSKSNPPKKGRNKAPPRANARKSAPARHGAVTSISTAPVSIGNSVRGSQPQTTTYQDGARVVGRDFAFQCLGTASAISNWELIGGMPITPCVMPSSVLRNFCQMYNKFKVNKVCIHYITSSPTSQSGDILFYYERDRFAPMVDYSNSSFLPYVLSDSNTVIGPQWSNHSMVIDPVKDWKTTLFGNQTDLNEDACGSIFMFSKTSGTNSPGYILIDYDITFREMSVNPRAGSLPIARGQMSTFGFGHNAVAVTAGTAYPAGIRGTDISGINSQYPSGYRNGDIYKCTVCATSSLLLNTWTSVNLSNLFTYSSDIDTPVVIDDGFTFYIALVDAVAGGGSTPSFYAYPTFDLASTSGSAGSNVGCFRMGVTGTVTWVLLVNAMLVGNTTSLTQSAY